MSASEPKGQSGLYQCEILRDTLTGTYDFVTGNVSPQVRLESSTSLATSWSDLTIAATKN
jgi:hypothetical protein